MTKTITVGTFNAENLFARFKFKGKKIGKGKNAHYQPWTPTQLDDITKEGWLIEKTFFEPANPDQRRITADAIKATGTDILALQEIENLDVLRRFNTKYLKSAYPFQLLIDSHDPRLIDVAIMSKLPFARIQTHQFKKHGRTWIFSRDCLEVDIDIGNGKILPIFVNHLKSMMEGREETADRRLEQSKEIVRILHGRFGADNENAQFIVLGDLNDYQEDAAPSLAIQELIDKAKLLNVNDRILNPDDRWTHFWKGGKEYKQLDYILLSPCLAKSNPRAVPNIVRGGMPLRAEKCKAVRFKGVDKDKLKASDHCPVAIELEIQ
jgi:endonuclease/exonuclease/phosphatase family metal-dependent hydrolase